jgi:male germ cell-associated kinase
VVFKALAPNDEIVAIKKMKSKYKSWEDVNVLREIKCLKKFEHPNIVKLREVILANSELFMVFDYLDCNLFQVYTRAK